MANARLRVANVKSTPLVSAFSSGIFPNASGPFSRARWPRTNIICSGSEADEYPGPACCVDGGGNRYYRKRASLRARCTKQGELHHGAATCRSGPNGDRRKIRGQAAENAGSADNGSSPDNGDEASRLSDNASFHTEHGAGRRQSSLQHQLCKYP